MTEEQNKLAEEIEQALRSSDLRDTGYAEPRIFIKASLAERIIAALRREPATEAVRDQVLEEALERDTELTRVLHRELLHTGLVAVEQWNAEIAPALSKLRNSIERALKGKGASQGDEDAKR